MKFNILFLLALSGHVFSQDFTRERDSRESFLIAHETLVSQLETQRIRLAMAKEGSLKHRRILCYYIVDTMKDLKEINIQNRKWQKSDELLRSEKHLDILKRKNIEIKNSALCKGS